MDFHQEQLAAIEFLRGMPFEKSDQSRHEWRNDLWMVVQLNGHDAGIAGWRIGYDVREIAIEGEGGLRPNPAPWRSPQDQANEWGERPEAR